MAFNMTPNLFQGGLNTDIKKMSPDGTVEFYPNPSLTDFNQSQGGVVGNGVSTSAPTAPAQPNAGVTANAPAPGQFNPIFGGDSQSLLVPLLLGQLASSIAQPNTWQSRLGGQATGFAQNQLFNQLLQGVLNSQGAQPNPFVSSSANLGPAIAGLTPEMQSQVFSQFVGNEQNKRANEMQPINKLLATSEAIKNLTPRGESQTNLQRITTPYPPGKDGLPDYSKTPNLKVEYEYRWNPQSGEVEKFITKRLKPSPSPSDSAARDYSISDLDSLISKEFLGNVEVNLRDNTELGDVRGLLKDFTDTQSGTPIVARMFYYLKPSEQKKVVARYKQYAKYSKNPEGILAFAQSLEEAVGNSLVAEDKPTGVPKKGDLFNDGQGGTLEFQGGDPNDENNYIKVK